MHVAFGGVTVLVMFLAIGFGAAAFGKRFRLYSIVSGVVLIAFGSLTFVEAPRLGAGLPTPWIGLWERINIGVFLMWVVVLATVLLRAPRGPAAADSRRSDGLRARPCRRAFLWMSMIYVTLPGRRPVLPEGVCVGVLARSGHRWRARRDSRDVPRLRSIGGGLCDGRPGSRHPCRADLVHAGGADRGLRLRCATGRFALDAPAVLGVLPRPRAGGVRAERRSLLDTAREYSTAPVRRVAAAGRCSAIGAGVHLLPRQCVGIPRQGLRHPAVLSPPGCPGARDHGRGLSAYPETGIEGMVGDVRRSVAWLKANALVYGVDPDRIVIGGGSAGGHIALLGRTPRAIRN